MDGQKQRYDAIILGAGAAGLMAAARAGQRGRRVLVIERADRVGKKILISGGGRLRAAWAVEGPPVRLDDDTGAAVRLALAEGPRETYEDAHQAFAAFMDGRPALRARPELRD